MHTDQVNNILSDLPPYKGQERMTYGRQSRFDIITELLRKHKETISHYDGMSLKHWRDTPEATAIHLFDFCRRNLPYKEEATAKQTVKTPGGILRQSQLSGSDCKHYASYIVGVGEALRRHGFPLKAFYRFASYNKKDRTPGHVFAVWIFGGKEYWIDPVPQISCFNDRTLYPVYTIDKKPYTPHGIGALYDISGLPPEKSMSGVEQGHWTDGIGCSMGKAKKKHKGIHIKIKPGKILKKVTGAPLRNAALAVLKLNVFNRAVKTFNNLKNPQFKADLYKMWENFGGNANKLSTAISAGVNTHNKLHKKHKISGYDDYTVMSGYPYYYPIKPDGMSMGVVQVAAAAVIAAATPFLIALGKLFKKHNINEDASDIAAMNAGNTSDMDVANNHNGATSIKGDGNADINPDGTVNHGAGVTTAVSTDPQTGKQTLMYDVREPNLQDEADVDTGIKNVIQDIQDKHVIKRGFEESWNGVKDFISRHKKEIIIGTVVVIATPYVARKLSEHKKKRR